MDGHIRVIGGTPNHANFSIRLDQPKIFDKRQYTRLVACQRDINFLL